MSTKNKISANKVLKKITGHISFGEMIYAYRMSLELSQVTFSELLEISKQDLCNIEKGRKLVSVQRAKRFAETLKMPPKVFAKYALQDQLNAAGIKGAVEILDIA